MGADATVHAYIHAPGKCLQRKELEEDKTATIAHSAVSDRPCRIARKRARVVADLIAGNVTDNTVMKCGIHSSFPSPRLR